VSDLTVDSFAPHVGERFALPEQGRELELIEARAHPGEPPPGRRAPFALLFRSPVEPILEQRTYEFEHPELGALAIFIVPVGRDDTGIRYEAIFG
jgi:uncharacterized protein DUF6916